MSLPSTLSFDAELDALRAELRAFIDAHDPPAATGSFGERVASLVRWQAALHAAGFVGLSWPVEHGGRGLGITAEAVLAEELARSRQPELINRIALYTVAPCLMQWATPEQLGRYLPGMLDAGEVWCQGFSEPDAGSDLASVRTRARTVDGGLRITGQKVWTSRALWSRWCALLVRTAGEPGEHRGLTLVALDMEAEGVEVVPLYQILHEEHFSEVFLDEVFVPDADVIGPVGEGWKVAMSTMGFERGIFVLERQIGLRRHLDELVAECRARGLGAEAAPALGSIGARLDVLRAHSYRTLAEQEAGTLAPGATSVDKLLLTDCYQDLYRIASDLLGPDRALQADEWAHELLESRSVSIYSGTTQIQHNVVAAQLLGLPRAR